ncbi:Peroxisome biogenesis protein 12 [Camellia lanceoleosa]|uniref:Peroxisome biogenesis protein 12 n=1 Tax=Camellia lanceoleosa TaxID=1840588 RepID=A0ACC0H301_9ERIC|nr:Peroxisome biogenesis protein 12 [Camellia lanceoleosa]
MAAAQQLPSSLRAALTYSIGVLALRRPFLHKVLDYEDEFFALLMLVLETHSLRTTDASFAESLYGLRRRAVKIRVKKDNPRSDVGDRIHHSGLEKHQKVLSVVFMVVLPYFKSKLHSIYNKEREARLRTSLWGDGDERFDDADNLDGSGNSFVSTSRSDVEASVATHLKKRIQKIVGACYPWLHAGNEGLSFAYQLLYLLDATGFYSLGLHALGIHVCRATGQELYKALLGCTYTVLDYMMEWWYQSAEERMSAPTVYPPPPPPPPPKVAKEGIPLPPDRTICSLCSEKRANPSVLTVSGFVFCYACVFKYVSQYKRCPVTLMPATVDQIRRLFHDV